LLYKWVLSLKTKVFYSFLEVTFNLNCIVLRKLTMLDVKGKWYFITGASRGVGR
jgi:hypothetical protein